jgi:uncharacterized membrane protein YtjA (UPF0391 family)
MEGIAAVLFDILVVVFLIIFLYPIKNYIDFDRW